MSRRARIVVIVLVVLAVVVADLGVDRLGPYLPAPALWADDATATKVAQLDERAGTGCVDVVFAGSSMARDALDPGRFAAADPDGRTAYNAALDAASPELQDQWLLHQVVPRVDPATVVLGMASFDLNDNAPITHAALDAYDAAPLSASGRMNRLQAWLTEHVALVRHRDQLRDPQTLWESLGRLRRHERTDRPSAAGIPGVVAPDGHGLSRRAQTYRPSPGVKRFVQQQLLADYASEGAQHAALEALVRDLRTDGTDVVLLLLPVTDDYIALHPRGAADQDAFEAEVADIAKATGATVVRAPAPGPGSFADTHHLNGTGSDALSSALPALLTDAGVPARHC